MSTRYVTKTGRAISPGKVTRSSNLIRIKRNCDKPLPMELQCHPKALTPTSMNPECYTWSTWQGLAHRLAHEMTQTQLLQHPELKREGRYKLGRYGYTDNIHFAMAFRIAAANQGLGGVDIEDQQ